MVKKIINKNILNRIKSIREKAVKGRSVKEKTDSSEPVREESVKKKADRTKYIFVISTVITACLLIICICSWYENKDISVANIEGGTEADENKKEFIKWVDFNVSYEALCEAYEWDVKTYEQETYSNHVNWIEVLACVAAKSGGSFSDKEVKQIKEVSEKLAGGETTIEELTKDLKYYNYYLEAYSAVLSGYVGEYIIVKNDDLIADKTIEEKGYGIKAYSPIAKGFPYSDYDDFGVSRSFGFKRQHLGHDMMGQIGTPIVAVESGYVEALGWNRYGGWRIGIRSFDKKRYYYYAHLRQNFPYCKTLQEGSVVTAGDVIGYMGHTGYSDTENVNNIDEVHLHFGIQLIFDESQKECNSEIWINPYNIVRFLQKNRTLAKKNEETKEWVRVDDIILPEVEQYINQQAN